MGKRIILVIRRSKDYWLYSKIGDEAIPLHTQPIIELWNSFFDLNLIDYRNKLREIASSTYLDNKFDQILLHSHISPKKMKNKDDLVNELYEDSIIVPMDEDDWIDPSLADILRNIETNKKFFVWNYYKTIREYEFEPFKEGRGRGWTMTCSWAIKGYNSFLKRHNHLKIKEEELSEIYFIRKPLSVKIEHVGCVGFLKKVVRKNWEKEDKWMNAIVSKIKGDLTVDEEKFPIAFQGQWKRYRKLLEELLNSKKNNV